MRNNAIVSRGNDTSANHRADFETCPHCHRASQNWHKIEPRMLIMEPACYKSSSVAVMTECPYCFEASWLHWRMDCFNSWTFPQKWIDRVKQKADAVRLQALRDWGAGLCYRCRHLESGKVGFDTWRHCVRGMGPALTECDRFEPVKEKKKS